MSIFSKEVKTITYDEIKKKLRASKEKEIVLKKAKVSSETEIKLNLDGYVVLNIHSHDGDQIVIRKGRR